MAKRGKTTSEPFLILPNERCLFVGKTGSGKTYAAKMYARGFSNVLVIDTKGTFNWENVPIIRTLDKLTKVGPGRFIYRPIDKEMNPDYYEGFFEFCYKRRNTVALVDELAQICESATDILPSWKDIMQRGRELNVGIFNCTQRPRFIPRMALSESEHTFCFRLKLDDDRKTMSEFMGRTVFETRLKAHAFFYMHETQEDPVLVAAGLPNES